jgi:WXG100 family type VII secretion target
MHVAAQALSGAAKDLHTRLVELDGRVRELLSGWHGGSGDAYGQTWDTWHRGAGEVQQGLSILAKAVGLAGIQFNAQDNGSSQLMDGVYRG